MGQRDDDKLVRQLSLVAFLMALQRPVTAEEIHEAVEGYGGMSEQAFLRRFYSDRSELEGVGLKLEVARPSDDPFQGDLYAMPPENYYLPPIEFDEAELSALHTSLYLLEGQFAYAEPLRLALQHLTLGRPSPLDDHAARTVAVNLLGSRHTSEVSSHLIKIESAISRRKTIRFRYYSIGRDDLGDREVDPYSLLYMAGNWYLVGYAHDREDLRCFRLSRIQGRITFKTRAEHDFPPPSEVDLSRYRDRSPWQLADPVGTAVIELSPTIAWWVDQMFRDQGEYEERADGSALFRTEYGGEREIISWVLGLGAEAQVLEPPALRDAAMAALELLRTRHSTKPRRRAKPLPRVAESVPVDDADDPSERVVPVERISRLLALMTRLLAACGRSYEAEVQCSALRSELNLTQEALEEDLTLLNLINFGGGCYALFAQVEGDEVIVQKEVYGDQFSRPARLSPLEAKALLWALDFVGGRLPLVGEESLASARRKIEDAVGEASTTGVELGAVQTASESVGAVLARAVREDRVIEIDYWTESRGEVTTRVIEPHMLMNSRDAWYLVAFCRKAGEQRTFRLDRIRGANPLDEVFERRVEVEAVPYQPWGTSSQAQQHAQIARVWCSPAIARWLAEEHPSAERFSDGSIMAEIPYASDEWLVKEITKHGGEAVLHTPEDLRAAVASYAERILEHYSAAPARR
ncbi:MAG: helix-turn-helix transcriptional regulator [Miltoncostaeaceae bacterium]